MSVEDLRETGPMTSEAEKSIQLAHRIDSLISITGPYTIGEVMSAFLSLIAQGFAKIHINESDEEFEKVMALAIEDIRLGEKINYDHMKPDADKLRLLSYPTSGAKH